MNIPDELKPSAKMYEEAKQIDEEYYSKSYEMLVKEMTPSEAVEVLSQIVAEKIALLIGFGLTRYDVGIIKGIVERHIISILKIEGEE